MVELLHVLYGWGASCDVRAAMSDDTAAVTRGELAARVAGMAEELHDLPQVIGLLGANGTDWAVAQLAAWTAGKIVVPLPTFFSVAQLAHVLRDAGITHIVATRDACGLAATLGVDTKPVSDRCAESFPATAPGAGLVVYTSGSTGHPKGVRLGLEQIDWQARALATAIEARQCDLHMSVLPLSLLLETIAAICVPILVGARTHFASAIAHELGAGRPSKLCAAFERRQPTTTVLVPQLLAGWIAELEAHGMLPPESLRFVAVGGAPVSEMLAARAWELGIPAHEGYGLTECCSVVAVNRPGRRKARTVGEPLPGLDVRIEEGEVVVSGPTVMAGYLHAKQATGAAWRTGDLGSFDGDGYLRVTGRMDDVLTTSSGRNISREWIEAIIASDPRICACVVVGQGEQYLSVLLIASPWGERWLTDAPRAHILLWLERICADAPAYAVPKDFVVCPLVEAKRIGLLTANGRIQREVAKNTFAVLRPTRRIDRSLLPFKVLTKRRDHCCSTIG